MGDRSFDDLRVALSNQLDAAEGGGLQFDDFTVVFRAGEIVATASQGALLELGFCVVWLSEPVATLLVSATDLEAPLHAARQLVAAANREETRLFNPASWDFLEGVCPDPEVRR
jgi:hypothetical protein